MATSAGTAGPGPGKQTLVEQAFAPVQQRAAGAPVDSGAVHTAAAQGIATPATALPHRDVIQRAFGRHDISGVQAHVGADAGASADAMGAQAYASGNHVVLGAGTDLHTVAHEAAHVVQQRGGVQLKGGVGAAGDTYERHADEVADAVVQGKSAEALLDRHAGAGGSAAAPAGVQQRPKRNKVGSAWMWFSTEDPEKQQFATKKEAEAREQVVLRSARLRPPRDRDDALPSSSLAGPSSAQGGSNEQGMDEDHAEEAPSVETVRALFLRCLDSLAGGVDRVRRAVVVDWDPAGLADMAGLIAHMTELEVASCFDTAGRLFELLGDASTNQGDWATKAVARDGIPQLIADIQGHAHGAYIYRVGMNEVAHGFTIAISNGRAEVIQGFAGASGESLATNLESAGGQFTIPEICKLLGDLIKGKRVSGQAQDALFSGRIDHEDDGTRDMNNDVFQVSRRNLYAPGVLEQRIRDKISAGLRALGGRRRR